MPDRPHPKGLDVAHSFHDEWVLPFLKAQFPKLVNRVATVLVGTSQSLGNDDGLSVDHGWGPTLTFLLPGIDMRRSGRRLRRLANESAPSVWNGAAFVGDPGDQLIVFSIDSWFRQEIGVALPPKTTAGWSRTRQTHLYMLRHSTVFHDPLGEFSKRRDSFHFYPRDVWLGQICTQLLMVWHHGQYNFVNRMVHRQDFITTSICLNQFVLAAMSLCMLLNGDYAPYWKWLPTEFRKQPNTADLAGMLEDLLLSGDTTKQVALIDKISRDIFRRLEEKNLVEDASIDDPNSLAKVHDALEAQIS